MLKPPLVDRRTPAIFAAKLREILRRELGAQWLATEARGDAANALVDIFAGMCGTVVTRLNQVPAKNLLAFLDLQGISTRGVQAARVPLTFSLAAKYQGHVTIPARTQVTAQPKKGEQQPVIFETEREFVVTSAQLLFAGTKNGSQDAFSDYTSILAQPSESGVSMFRTTTPIEHLLAIDLKLALPANVLKELQLDFQITSPKNHPPNDWLQWEIILNADQSPSGVVINPLRDDTNGLAQSGSVFFQNLPPVPSVSMNNGKGQWLACRLALPVASRAAALSSANLPSINSVQVVSNFGRDAVVPDAAVFNQVPLDISKEFFPFGERPKYGDTFYLASSEAFSIPGASISMQFISANPEVEAPDMRIPPVRAYAAKLRWELGDGKVWIDLGTAESAHEIRDAAMGFSDTTRAFTRTGTVTFRIPREVAPLTIGNANNLWVRCRLVAGDYGADMPVETPGPTMRRPSVLGPPCLHSVRLDYALTTTAAKPLLIGFNDFQYTTMDPQVAPARLFRPVDGDESAFYLGFFDEKGFSNRSMSAYAVIANPNAMGVTAALSGQKPALLWEYWNGATWNKYTVIDGTEGLTSSGIVRFLAPPDFGQKAEFGKNLYWLRLRFRDNVAHEPYLKRVVMNTTLARQAITLLDEQLGTGDGTAGQTFVTLRSPVLEGQQLEILEASEPSSAERQIIIRDEGEDAIRPAGKRLSGQFWIRWHEVPNFNGSNRESRHYAIDRATGRITFGDGSYGRVAPPVDRNVVMRRYQTGGGAVGNRLEQTITQLNSAIAFVDRVTNLEPSSGGADAESYDAVLERAPFQIRHRGRAITAQDYEDLARIASAEVARVRCLPASDLSKGKGSASWSPGSVTLIIAPADFETESTATRLSGPQPSPELVQCVKDYLDARRPLEANLLIVGPEYVIINTEIEVMIGTDASPSDLELAITLAVSRFLHPITGKRDGKGWQFGEYPSRSELLSLIAEIPGVDHVRELQIKNVEPRTDTIRDGQFLIWGSSPSVGTALEV